MTEEEYDSKKSVVIDLDGTLCNTQHRQHLAAIGEWDHFHSMCTEDEPFDDIEQFIFTMREHFQVILLTARPEKFRTQTEEWLRSFMIEYDVLLMKADGDYRKTSDFKLQSIEQYFGSKDQALETVAWTLEDDDKNVEAFRNYGLPCWQVRPQGY